MSNFIPSNKTDLEIIQQLERRISLVGCAEQHEAHHSNANDALRSSPHPTSYTKQKKQRYK